MKDQSIAKVASSEEFLGYVRSAMHYLYDPFQLRRCALVTHLGLNETYDPADVLQRMLIEAIHALRPSEDEPPQSTTWQVYDLLNMLYIRQYTREAVANQIGVSERQMRREVRVAMEALANYLWKTHGLAHTTEETEAPKSDSPAETTSSEHLDAELVWVKNSAADRRDLLGTTIITAGELASSLASQWGTSITWQVEDEIHNFLVNQLVIRNILLTILNIAIPRSSGSPVKIHANRSKNQINICVLFGQGQPQTPLNEKETGIAAAAQKMAHLYESQLGIDPTASQPNICLSLPVPELIPLVVIDDNHDWLEMVQRYAASSPYQVIAIREPETAHDQISKTQPKVIFVDVMMPNADGWQVISKLRNDQATSSIPIVVCSVLPLEEFALSLGVNAFLQKPVTQEQFLRTIRELSSGGPDVVLSQNHRRK